jgi:hypothetical protein
MSIKVNKSNSSWSPASANFQAERFDPARPFPTTGKTPQFNSLQLQPEEGENQWGDFVYKRTSSVRAKTQGMEASTENQTTGGETTGIPSRPSIIQRVCDECAKKEQENEEAPPESNQHSFFQPKLTLAAPEDKYEQEADQVAQQVVPRINTPQTTVNSQVDTQEEKSIQRKSSGNNLTLRSHRQDVENATPTDNNADQLNHSIQARAFATGNDIFFKEGEYNPSSRGGQELLAHELTHVVQQTKSSSPHLSSMLPKSQSNSHEMIPGYTERFASRSLNSTPYPMIQAFPSPAVGHALKYGETKWEPSSATYPKVEIEYTAAKEKSKFMGKVKPTTSKMGSVTMWSLPAGEHLVASSVHAKFPQCGKSGKKVPFYTKVSPDIAQLARIAEEEHKSDYTRTYNLTLVKWSGIINTVAKMTFGPDTKIKVRHEIDKTLTSKGNKSKAKWNAEINRLNKLSLQRDTPRGKCAHSLKPDGEPISCPDDCSKVVGTSVTTPYTKVPGVSSASLIN